MWWPFSVSILYVAITLSETLHCDHQPPVGTCFNVTIVDRDQWRARKSKKIELMGTPVDVVFIHHTDTKECYSITDCSEQVRQIQNFHKDVRGWDDIGYNFLIGEDGRAYNGRGWDRIGAHTKGWDDVAIAFSMIGNFSAKIPNDGALAAVENMIECGVKKGKISPNYKVYGHRDVEDTDCPGDSLYKLIRTWSHYDKNTPVKPKPRRPDPALCPHNETTYVFS